MSKPAHHTLSCSDIVLTSGYLALQLCEKPGLNNIFYTVYSTISAILGLP